MYNEETTSRLRGIDYCLFVITLILYTNWQLRLTFKVTETANNKATKRRTSSRCDRLCTATRGVARNCLSKPGEEMAVIGEDIKY